MIDNVLAHHQTSRRHKISGAPTSLTAHRSQGAAVDVEPGHLLGQGLGDDEYLDVEAVEEIP